MLRTVGTREPTKFQPPVNHWIHSGAASTESSISLLNQDGQKNTFRAMDILLVVESRMGLEIGVHAAKKSRYHPRTLVKSN